MLSLSKLGIIVDSVNYFHLGVELTTNLNKFITHHPDIDVIVFTNEPSFNLVEKQKFSIMHTKETWRYDGVLISTNMLTTEILMKSPCCSHKFFYCWDLEWMYQERPSFQYLNSLYNNNSIPLISRNEQYHKIISNVWKTPVTLIEEFNHEQLFKLFKRTRQCEGQNIRLLS